MPASRNRWLAPAIVAALIATHLGGCRKCSEPDVRTDGASSRVVIKRTWSPVEQRVVASRFFEHMRAHRFAQAYAMFERSLAHVSKVSQLDKTWRELEQSLGGIQRVEPPKTRAERGHQVHLYRCHGSRAAGNVKVMTRSATGEVVGFFVTGSGLAPH